MEEGYSVKISKKTYIIGVVAIILTIGIILVPYWYFFDDMIHLSSLSGDDFSITIFCFVCCTLFIGTMIGCIIYITFDYKNKRDIYFSDKLVRMKGKKKKFEIEYKDILRVQSASYETVLLYCKKPFNKGATTMIGHYNDNDLQNIKRIISNANFTVRFD